MTETLPLGVWLVATLSFLFILFYLKNGRKKRFHRYFRRLRRSLANRRNKLNSEAYLRHLRSLVIKPKPLRAFIPLFILIIVVLLLLNNYLYFAVVTSDSMSPTFNKGDMVLMTEFTDVNDDDIIMFSAPDEPFPVLHRVHNIRGDNITTKGDFNPVEDSWTINETVIHSEAITIGDKPVVLKGVGTYFLEEPSHEDDRYSSEIEFNRLLLTGMKNLAILIFVSAVLLYIILTIRDMRERKVS